MPEIAARRLEGNRALVTGAASGIGAATVRRLALEGAAVLACDLRGDAVKEMAQSLIRDGYQVIATGCDITQEDDVAAACDLAEAEFGGLDVLVANAGRALPGRTHETPLGPAEDLTLGAWDDTLSINLRGTFLMCQAVGRHMLAAGRGKIINMASQAGTVALERHAAYCASKFAVIGLTRVLACEWGARGLAVNTISPTVVLTDLGRQAWAGEAGETMKRLIPKGRFAEPEEIAAAAVYLASDYSDMVNGADLVIDGGYTVR